MGSFGERLQREREMRGITLEEIAEATKIGTRALRALEEQEFDKLPGGIFNKGFVRAYSRYLGIDEDQAVADYMAALTEAQAVGKATRPEPTTPAIHPEAGEEQREPIQVPWGLVLIAVVMVVAAVGGWRYYARHGFPKLRLSRSEQRVTPAASAAAKPALADTKAETPSVTSAPVAPSAPAPEIKESRPETAPQAGTPAPVQEDRGAPAAGGFVVRLKATQDAWVSVVADGKHVASAVLPSSSERQFRAERQLVITTGNAGGLEISHNGKTLGPVGEAGKKRTLVFTPGGLQTQ